MQYWIDDDDTDAVGLYLESIGNPRKFSRIARHLASHQAGHRGQVRRRRRTACRRGTGRAPTRVPPGGVRRDAAPGRGDPGRERAPALRRRPAASCTSRCPAATGWRSWATPTALGALTAEACISWDLEVTHGPVSRVRRGLGGRVSRGHRGRVRRRAGRQRPDLLHPAAGHRSTRRSPRPSPRPRPRPTSPAPRRSSACAASPRRCPARTSTRTACVGSCPPTRCPRTPCARWPPRPGTASGGRVTRASGSPPPASTGSRPSGWSTG